VVIDLLSSKIDRSTLLHLKVGQQNELLELLDCYADCFSSTPGLCKVVLHEIPTISGLIPKRLRAYRIPDGSEVNRQIKDLGFIQESNSPMASCPIVFVMKKWLNGQCCQWIKSIFRNYWVWCFLSLASFGSWFYASVCRNSAPVDKRRLQGVWSIETLLIQATEPVIDFAKPFCLFDDAIVNGMAGFQLKPVLMVSNILLLSHSLHKFKEIDYHRISQLIRIYTILSSHVSPRRLIIRWGQ